MKDNPTCETCRWFKLYKEDDPRGYGDCYRYPPKTILVTSLGGEGSPEDHRPGVFHGDFCGEHSGLAPKEPKIDDFLNILKKWKSVHTPKETEDE